MPGTVLLLAASPVGKGCLVDAASVLPVLAAVSPAVLSGTDTANVVELADPLEPQAVLTRLRAAAASPGPLTVFLTGQLQLDRRQRLPHLALARTTPATVRYTAFPWHWITEELRLRPAGTTTLLVDLHADAETWDHLAARPLTAGPSTALYGRIAPPPPRRSVAAPAYMRAAATVLRSGHRPPLAALHQQALTRATGEEARPGPPDIVLTPQAVARPWHGAYGAAEAAPAAAVPPPLPAVPPTAPPTGGFRPAVPPAAAAVPGDAHTGTPAGPDPHETITAAVRAGRHGEAEALAGRREQEALRTHGPASEQVLHWMEVRADLAMFAADPERSCRTWLTVADARLGAGQAPDSPAVESAVDRAHHQWGLVGDAVSARELGSALAELRRRVPGRRQGALDHVRQQLRQLQTQA
ncbi:hypothetical protein AB9Q10_12105 [Streptomyces krungchingensis]|uniref:hypothetical protein n=1 Tax=Streptomyces krungchingensis TaxID=1565034 RepID=UPI003CF7F067